MKEGEGHGMALKVLPAFLPYPSRRLRPRFLLSGAYKPEAWSLVSSSAHPFLLLMSVAFALTFTLGRSRPTVTQAPVHLFLASYLP